MGITSSFGQGIGMYPTYSQPLGPPLAQVLPLLQSASYQLQQLLQLGHLQLQQVQQLQQILQTIPYQLQYQQQQAHSFGQSIPGLLGVPSPFATAPPFGVPFTSPATVM